eukprot:GHRR01008341.1.p1 GENE.GHRR01008341.1~~GHRR01008341.1.p1  ORF type:complete len:252 (+),score=63.02 GHRR01008341.1:248-1003(+)
MAAVNPRMPYFLAAVSLLLVCSLTPVTAQWRSGRATFYGNEPWYWSIHHGSCGEGYLWPDEGTGWDVAALSDQHPDYAGSCGRCYEIKCDNSGIKDGYGDYLDRDGACTDPDASVILTISDTCPCQYSANYFSNKRWCCGDMDHFDVSVWAFQKLTNMKWGVVPIQYRQVDCGQQPSKKADPNAATFPGEFPPLSQADERSDFDYYRYFPQGGYLNSHAGDGSRMVSTDEYLRMVANSGYESGSSAQYGKK